MQRNEKKRLVVRAKRGISAVRMNFEKEYKRSGLQSPEMEEAALNLKKAVKDFDKFVKTAR